MRGFLLHWLTLAVALTVTTYVVPGVDIRSPAVLAVAALVLGFINAIVRPILVLLTLPITILTLGFFYLVVNGLSFALAAALVPGFEVGGLGAAIIGALVLSVVSWLLGVVTGDRGKDERK